MCGYGARGEEVGVTPPTSQLPAVRPLLSPPSRRAAPPKAGLKSGDSDPSPETGSSSPRARPGPCGGSHCLAWERGWEPPTPSAARKQQGLCPKCSQEERPRGTGQCGPLAALSRSGGGGMRQAGRAATEKTTRGPDAPELPSNMGHMALGVPLVLAACQASLGQQGARGASGFPPAPLAKAEANLARTGDTREGAGRKEPRSEYCTVLGAGLSVSGGKRGTHVGAERAMAAGPPRPQLVPPGRCHRTSHRGTGVAPASSVPRPAAGLATREQSGRPPW